MKCMNCQAEISALVKFCPECGNQVLAPEDVRSKDTITLSWIKDVLETQGYEVEPSDYGNVILADCRDGWLLNISLLSETNIIHFSVAFGREKLSFGTKTAFYTALTKANLVSDTHTATYDEDDCQVTISSYLYITDKISRLDIIRMVNRFKEHLDDVLDTSYLREFL